jgi:hypothetical protein
MKQALLAILICAAWILPVQSDGTGNPDIEATISRQIDAFKADDFIGAFGFASDNIQRVFRTPERFGQMVRHGYPMVYRPDVVRFLELREVDGALRQKVEMRDRAGTYHLLDYEMIDTEAGWKIDAVRYLGAGPGIGA